VMELGVAEVEFDGEAEKYSGKAEA
jgi:hypothetical protein